MQNPAVAFKARNGLVFSFSITGYQFPDIESFADKYDKNWLNVRVNIKDKSGAEFNAEDPSILTWELKELLEWFKTISRGKEPEYNAIGFIEPAIYFELLDKSPDSKVKIRIHLCCELKPKQLKPNHEDDEFVIDVDLSPKDIEEAINGLEKIIELFPQR
ncbi:WapI family immunity protein [Hippea sp. KM1]|uniref:WapI family immunity protein n=1 Tax=Hippea sp. KM1 TaxID=944481 RepID=UPI00046CF8C4|nr:hypothetical protein [Hippea sp. KM1]